MSPELQKELAAWLAQLRNMTQQGANFAIEQAPLVIQEKVALGRFYETLWLAFGLVVIACLLSLSLYLWRHRHEFEERADLLSEGLPTAGCVMATIATIVSALLTLSQSYYAAQVWVAPRLYIIEWLASLVKA